MKKNKTTVKEESCSEEVSGDLSCVVDHKDEIVAEFSNLYRSEAFSDVELVVNETERFKVHRVVLGLSSDVFHQMLSGGRWQEGGQQDVALTEDESCVEHMDAFLQYFYTGTISISAENLFPLLILTDKYNVKALREECELFALENICSGSVSRALSWWRKAEQIGFQELEEACCCFVALNGHAFLISCDWLSLELERLIVLLQRDDLQVENEFQLFHAVKQWLLHNKVKQEDILGRVLDCIRFPLMSPLEVYNTSGSDMQPACVRDRFLTESTLIYKVNSVPMEAIGLYHDTQAPRFTMRLYTSASFGCSLKVDNFNNAQSRHIDFTTKLFQTKTSWRVRIETHYYHNYYYSKSPQDSVPPWTCRIQECNLLNDGNHEHQLSVLMFKRVGDIWLACDYETYSIPHEQDVPLTTLHVQLKKNKCIHKNKLFVHFIGKTRRVKFA